MLEFERKLGDQLSRWVSLVARHPLATLVGALLLTAVSLHVVVHQLGVNANEDDLFADDLPHLVLERQFHDAFPVLFENLVVVIDGRTPEQARDAADALAARMEADASVFRGVYLPRNEFFDRNGLLYLEIDELEELADRLAEVQPYLAGLAEDGSLRGLSRLLARGARALRDGDAENAELGPMFERVAAGVASTRRGEAWELSWTEVLAGGDLDPDATRRLVIAQPVLDFSDLLAGEAAIEAVRGHARALGLTPESGVRVRLTGDIALSTEELTLVQGQAAMAGLASLVLVAVLLYLALRSVRLIFATLLTLVLGLVWTAAFAALAIGHLNLISVAFAVLFIGLGVDFGIHLCMRYQEVRDEGEEHAAALRETVRGVGGSLVLCAGTTAVGFFAFVPTDFAGVAELGLISGCGVLLSLVGSLTVLPAVMSLRVRTAARPRREARGMGLPRLPLRHPRAVGGLALVLAVGAIAMLPSVHFDQNPLRVRDPGSESVRAFRELLDDGRTSPWGLDVLAPDLSSASALAQELSALEVVDSAETVADYIPEQQDEKLEMLADLALFLAPETGRGSDEAPSLADQRAALFELRDDLDALVASGAAPSVTPAAAAARDQLSQLLDEIDRAPDGGRASLAALESGLLSTLPAQLEMLERSFQAERVTLEDLPSGLVARLVSPDGAVRVRIFPRDDLFDADALERFVADVREVAPSAVGVAIRIHESGRAVVSALQEAFVSAAVVIALLLLVIWRAVGYAALVMGPLLMAALFTGAGAVLLGIPFNFADVIVLPLLLGIGVDSAIHLVNRYRMRGTVEGLLETSTARAIVYSCLTTVGSFGSLAFASHQGMASLGQLLALGVVLTMLCNLFVLPAFIALHAERHGAAPPKGASAGKAS